MIVALKVFFESERARYGAMTRAALAHAGEESSTWVARAAGRVLAWRRKLFLTAYPAGSSWDVFAFSVLCCCLVHASGNISAVTLHHRTVKRAGVRRVFTRGGLRAAVFVEVGATQRELSGETVRRVSDPPILCLVSRSSSGSYKAKR